MPRYDVNAMISMPAWVSVIADNEDEALETARGMSAGSFEYDTAAATVEFNLEPIVELQ